MLAALRGPLPEIDSEFVAVTNIGCKAGTLLSTRKGMAEFRVAFGMELSPEMGTLTDVSLLNEVPSDANKESETTAVGASDALVAAIKGCGAPAFIGVTIAALIAVGRCRIPVVSDSAIKA